MLRSIVPFWILIAIMTALLLYASYLALDGPLAARAEMVPMAGLEPACPYGRQDLTLLGLPFPHIGIESRIAPEATLLGTPALKRRRYSPVTEWSFPGSLGVSPSPDRRPQPATHSYHGALVAHPQTVTISHVAGRLARPTSLFRQAILFISASPTLYSPLPKDSAVACYGAPRRSNLSIDEALSILRTCESGGDYGAVSDNGLYFGAYQFSLSTWQAVGGEGYPHLASPQEQDFRAGYLLTHYGAGQWPVCGRLI